MGRVTGEIVRIGCDGHTHIVLVDQRYLRWRCKDRNCPDVVKAHANGLWAFHVHDLQTGERWTEWEAVTASVA